MKITQDNLHFNSLKVAFKSSPAILGLEETNRTNKIGKWFVITNQQNEQEARKFIDFELPLYFWVMDTPDIKQFTYPFFPFPCRGNVNHRRPVENIAKTLG